MLFKSGHLFSKRTPPHGYKNPHYKPRVVWLPSLVYIGNPYANKTVSSSATMCIDLGVSSRKKRLAHDDVIKWKHFPRYWPFVRGIHRSPVNSLHKGQWRGVLMFSLICTWINGRVNNREAGNLRRYHAHYDVTVMCLRFIMAIPTPIRKIGDPVLMVGISSAGLLWQKEIS